MSKNSSRKTSRLLRGLETSSIERLHEHLEGNGQPPPERRIFVNRTLRMESIRFVGFDLDWTLADYERLPLEEVTISLTINRLIEHHSYPEAIRAVDYRPDFPLRGLLIDKEAGTVLKMNRHRYVNLAYLGRERLDREELKRLYRWEPIHPASDRFYHLDSLFELPEANLYAELIEIAKTHPEAGLPTAEQIFDDLRSAVDWVHRDGALKKSVLSELDRYLRPDPELALALQRLALNGRRLFVLTNSDWEYVQAVCSFLFDDLLPGLDSWRSLFDLVLTKAGKPDYFRHSHPFNMVEPPQKPGSQAGAPAWGGVYEKGSLEALMRLIGEPGEHVLYVGDHIYGDIVSSKQESTWRTTLIVRELEEELTKRKEYESDIQRQIDMQKRISSMGHEMDHLRDVIAVSNELIERGADLPQNRLPSLRRSFDTLSGRHYQLLREEGRWSDNLAKRFNPYWGSLFKQGTSQTRFASQLESYACLYTSRVSNFAFYGTDRYFRVSQDPMMHELERKKDSPPKNTGD